MVKSPLNFLLDENVPSSLLSFLNASGHKAISIAEVHLAKGSPDVSISAIAAQSGLILVSFDRDFNKIKKDIKKHNKADKLSLLKMSCHELNAVQRTQEALSLIEFEWEVARKNKTKLIHIEIGKSYIKTNR